MKLCDYSFSINTDDADVDESGHRCYQRSRSEDGMICDQCQRAWCTDCINKGLSPRCLAGLQAEWFDRTELESQDRSARRPRIETSHVDLQDVRSAKLQACKSCMKSAKPTHLTRELERTKRFKRPGTELEWATVWRAVRIKIRFDRVHRSHRSPMALVLV